VAMRVEGKVAIITRAASAIGAAMVRLLAAEGARVALSAPPSTSERLDALSGPSAKSMPLSVTGRYPLVGAGDGGDADPRRKDEVNASCPVLKTSRSREGAA